MPNIVADYYKQYLNTVDNFERFHEEVINMPRPTFSEIPSIVKLLKSLASYILLIDEHALHLIRKVSKVALEGVPVPRNRELKVNNNFTI